MNERFSHKECIQDKLGFELFLENDVAIWKNVDQMLQIDSKVTKVLLYTLLLFFVII